MVQSWPDLQDLNLEQKVKRLQKEHPGLTAGYLQHALEASDLDLSLATALVLSAEEGSPQTPDAEVRLASDACPPATKHVPAVSRRGDCLTPGMKNRMLGVMLHSLIWVSCKAYRFL